MMCCPIVWDRHGRWMKFREHHFIFCISDLKMKLMRTHIGVIFSFHSKK